MWESPPDLPTVEPQHRDVQIRRAVELQKFGFTQNCKGCYQAAIGVAPANHSEACRMCIKAAMRTDPDLANRVNSAEDAKRAKTAITAGQRELLLGRLRRRL